MHAAHDAALWSGVLMSNADAAAETMMMRLMGVVAGIIRGP